MYIMMQCIAKSECPRELAPAPGDVKSVVHVNLTRKEGDYKVYAHF